MRELRVTNVRFNSDTVKKLHTISDLRCREEEKATSVYTFTIWPKQKVYDALTSGNSHFYTEVDDYRADVIPINDQHGQYVKTKPDSTGVDNLLRLPEF